MSHLSVYIVGRSTYQKSWQSSQIRLRPILDIAGIYRMVSKAYCRLPRMPVRYEESCGLRVENVTAGEGLAGRRGRRQLLDFGNEHNASPQSVGRSRLLAKYVENQAHCEQKDFKKP